MQVDGGVHRPSRRQWRANMVLVNAVEFVSESSRGLTLPTLYLYVKSLGGDVRHLSVLIAIFSVGRLVASPLFGWISQHVSFRAASVC